MVEESEMAVDDGSSSSNGDGMEASGERKELTQLRTEEGQHGEDRTDSHGSDDEEEGLEGRQEREETSLPTLLSKSWKVAKAHVPTFSGGKVMHSFAVGGNVSADNRDDGIGSTVRQSPQFLLLPIDGDVAIVDAKQGVKIRTLRGGDDDGIVDSDMADDEDDSVDQEAVTSYTLSRDNRFVMTCSRNQLLRQYAIQPSSSSSVSVELSKTWGKSGHTLPVSHMELHPSGVFLATGSVDGTVRVWDVRGTYVTHVFRPIADDGTAGGSGLRAVTSLRWQNSLSELVIAVARDDGSVAIHNLRDAKHVNVLRDHDSSVTSMEWFGTSFFVSTGRDAVINLWRIVAQETSTPSKGSKKHNDKSKKKKTKQQKLQENVPRRTYRRIQTLPVYEQVEGMAIIPDSLPDEMIVATAGSKGVVRMWKAHISNSATPQLKLFLEQPKEQAFGNARGGYLGLIFNENALQTAEDDDGNENDQLIAVDAEQNISLLSSALTLDRTIVGHNDEVLDLKVIPNTSTKIVVATNSPQIRIFDLDNFSCDVLYGHTANALCVAPSPCGRLFASCGKDRTMRLWHVDSKRCVSVATGHTEPVGACALSQKPGRYDVAGKAARNGGGSFAITASLDKTIKRWNLPSVDELAKVGDAIDLVAASSIRAHEKDINIISVAPNDSIVATGSQDKTVKLWNATNLSPRAVLRGHRRGVWDCQFSPIDRVLATSSGDKTIKLWSLGDFSCVRTFQGHVASVLRIRFLHTGLQLLSAGGDGLLKLWTIRTNQCEATLDGHSNKVWALDLCSDGVSAVSGGADSKILLWNDNTQAVADVLRAKEAESILLEQKLANHMRHKEFGKALQLSLQANKPLQALKVFNAIIESSLQKKRNPLGILQAHVKTWSMEQTAKVLKYCREWNTRARNSHVAMLVVKAVMTTVPVQQLVSHQPIPDILAGIMPYAERHFDRLDRLYTDTFLLDFTLSSMGKLDPVRTDGSENGAFEKWERSTKLVLPNAFVDGRIQVGGREVVGKLADDADRMDASDEEVVTLGDSDSSDSDGE